MQWLHRPYSYVTTFDHFPAEVQVWDLHGAVMHTMASLPLFDRVPVHGVPTGPRDFQWRATDPATLTWTEALDGGDWNVKVPARDKVLLQKAPFTAAPVEILRTEQRVAGIAWAEQPSLALVFEYDANRHWIRTFTLNVDAGGPPKLLFDLSADDHYKSPGSPVLRLLPNGQRVVRQEGNRIYFSGMGSSPDGDRPFLDALDVTTQTRERLFRSAKTDYEGFVAFADSTRSFITLATPNAERSAQRLSAPAGRAHRRSGAR